MQNNQKQRLDQTVKLLQNTTMSDNPIETQNNY